MQKVKPEGLAIACACAILGFMLAVQFRTVEGLRTAGSSVSVQRVDELTERLREVEAERDGLKESLRAARANDVESDEALTALKIVAAKTALRGQGVVVRLDDSNKTTKAGENPNLYVIHDDDLLKVINELRAAGAEAVAVNVQRLTGTSEIRCAGPTLSVNNVRSAAPFEVRAIGDKHTLESALKMRGGVEDALKVWGIQLAIETSDEVYIPPFKGQGALVYGVAVPEEVGP